MSHLAIRVDGVSKRYRVGIQRERYRLLRDQLSRLGAAALRRAKNGLKASRGEETFLALDDVSFDVPAGEVVGVIGRNGAGKSTLLKILSRITEPTSGKIDIAGRVGSLLEVGTGFHPELTGRENVYLNGAILGMRRREIDRKFDEIVSFAEVERFIDSPVKHYSSGMYLRLAFAVAAHLEPEILLVDEVLAVGDVAFQRKCVAKMNAVAQLGQTVLFVSHNLAAIKELCTSCVVLDNGQVKFRGSSMEGLVVYSGLVMSAESDAADHCEAGFSQLRLECRGGNEECWVASAEPFVAHVRLRLARPLETARLYCLIDSSSGDAIMHSCLDTNDGAGCPTPPGTYQVRVVIPPIWLVPDAYTLRFKLFGTDSDRNRVKAMSDQVIVDVRDGHGQGGGKVRARLIPRLEWSIKAGDQEARLESAAME